jgi:hypothetical protein
MEEAKIALATLIVAINPRDGTGDDNQGFGAAVSPIWAKSKYLFDPIHWRREKPSALGLPC